MFGYVRTVYNFSHFYATVGFCGAAVNYLLAATSIGFEFHLFISYTLAWVLLYILCIRTTAQRDSRRIGSAPGNKKNLPSLGQPVPKLNTLVKENGDDVAGQPTAKSNGQRNKVSVKSSALNMHRNQCIFCAGRLTVTM